MHRHTHQKSGPAGMPSPLDVRGAKQVGDLYHLCFDESSGIILTIVGGFWTVADTDAYFERLDSYVAAARQRLGRVSVLVDRRGSPVQSPGVALRMQQANRDLFLSDDRLAIVVDSSLVKLQLRRLFTHKGSRAFLSYDAAVTWLKARP